MVFGSLIRMMAAAKRCRAQQQPQALPVHARRNPPGLGTTLGLYSAFLALAATVCSVILVFRLTVATRFWRMGVMPEAGAGSAAAAGPGCAAGPGWPAAAAGAWAGWAAGSRPAWAAWGAAVAALGPCCDLGGAGRGEGWLGEPASREPCPSASAGLPQTPAHLPGQPRHPAAGNECLGQVCSACFEALLDKFSAGDERASCHRGSALPSRFCTGSCCAARSWPLQRTRPTTCT